MIRLTLAQVQAAEAVRAQAWAVGGLYQLDNREREALYVGMVANAWGESRLNPEAVGDNGRSFGLFQLHDSREWGPDGAALGDVAQQLGVSRDSFTDPHVNARVIAWASLNTREVVQALSGTVGDVARAITIHVERPANAAQRANERAGYIAGLFRNRITADTPVSALR